MNKISLIVSIGAMVFLYLIGFIANIDFLVFKISPSSIEIALLPIAVGLLIAFISDAIIKYKFQKHEN